MKARDTLPASLAANARLVGGDLALIRARADELDAQADFYAEQGDLETAADLRAQARTQRDRLPERLR